MNAPERGNLWQRLKAVQSELIEGLGGEMGEPMAPKLERLVHTLDGLRIEDFVADGLGVGRPRRERFARANAFVAKAVLGLQTTVVLIDRLKVDRALRRICGFTCFKRLRSRHVLYRCAPIGLTWRGWRRHLIIHFGRALACLDGGGFAADVADQLLAQVLFDQRLMHPLSAKARENVASSGNRCRRSII